MVLVLEGRRERGREREGESGICFVERLFGFDLFWV